MAVAPLFNPDMNTLKSKLRLSGAVQADATAMIDSAVQGARARMITALGTTRITQLVAIGYTENPVDADGVLRLRCNQIEVDMVKAKLLRDLPVLFMDTSNVKREAWNEEGLTRLAAEKDLANEIARLESDIAAGLAEVADTSNTSVGEVQGGAMESTRRVPHLGGSVFRRWPRDNDDYRGGRSCR